ncbi:hypothetical protein VCR29J2_990032 [Vibrio coralliirubri]|nr:hypothetical protein VCR29J2_990032 [Vibrio coralliirubri]
MAQIRQAKNAKHHGAISIIYSVFYRHKKAELMLGFCIKNLV